MRKPSTHTALPRFVAMDADAVTVARRLLGQRLVRVHEGVRLAGTIIEVEAYLGAEDRAAHTFGGRRTPRNESMYLPGGHAYVYFTYGMHFCLNVVCGRRDEGVAVLLRAIEPTEGVEHMHRLRPRARMLHDLCSGPGKLTQALAIDRDLDGENLLVSTRLFIEHTRVRRVAAGAMGVSARIGLNLHPKGAGEWAHRPLRFYLKTSLLVSRRPRQLDLAPSAEAMGRRKNAAAPGA